MVNTLIIQHPDQDTSYVKDTITENNVIVSVPDLSRLGLKKSNGNLYLGTQSNMSYLHYGPPRAGPGDVHIDSRLAGIFQEKQNKQNNQKGGAKEATTFAELEPHIWDIINDINNDNPLSDDDIKLWKRAFALTISDDLLASPKEVLRHWWYYTIWRVNDLGQEKEDQFESLAKPLNTPELLELITSFFSFEELKACGVL